MPRVLLDSLERVERLFASSPLEKQWQYWEQQMGSDISINLRDITAVLDPEGTAARRTIPHDSLVYLRTQLTECLKDVEKAGPVSPLYDYLSDALESIIGAIDDYRVIGLSGLMSVVESVQAEAPSEAVLSNVPPRLRRTLLVIALVAFLTHVVGQGIQDAESVLERLPWSHQQGTELIVVEDHKDSVRIAVQEPDKSDGHVITLLLS